jgi:negative regulator of sigma E activity
MNRGRLVGTLLGTAALIAVSAAIPARSADLYDLLRRSVTADRRYDYQGTKVLARWSNGHEIHRRQVKVYHLAPDRTLMEKADDSSGPQAMLQCAREVYARFGPNLYSRLPLPPPLDNTEAMLRNYRLRQQRVEMVARRRCVMISIEPRYPGNPRKVVWLDVKTALPLKAIVYDSAGNRTEECYFLTLQYNPNLSMGRFYLPPNTHREEWPEVSPDFRVVRPAVSSLPRGYRTVESYVRRVRGGYIVAFLRFSDGLNTLTMLQSRTHPNLRGLDSGPVADSGRIPRTGVHYVLFGQQEPRSLRNVTRSIQGKAASVRVESQ